jgi:hypothetical protein
MTLGMSIAILAGIAMEDLVVAAELLLTPPPAVRDVGSRKQLFIDHRFVEQKENVWHVVNPPEEHVPVLPGEGFETEHINGYSTVIQQRADGRYGSTPRCWTTMPR